MQDILKRIKFPALTFLIALLVLFYYFHEALLHPNDYLFASGGDGIKNYYTYLFHAQYDSSFWNFGGMNYPYYEHIVYTDAHPLLSWVIGKLGLAHYGIGILNLLMLLSYPICAVFLYLILRYYKISLLWAIAAAIAITFMSPQLFRLSGHFALSYTFAIPAMWWILIQCRQGNAGLWSIVSFAYIMLFFFTHPYLGAILALFCAVFWLIVYLYNRGEWKNSIGFTTVQLILPFLLFRLIIFATDTHVNRMDTPGGFFHFYGAWSSIIAAPHGPINEVMNAIGVRFKSWESIAYVGLSTLVFFLFIMGYVIYNRKVLPVKTLLRHQLMKFVIAAYILLIFSFCFPFKLEWFQWIPDYFGPLKQFRVLGRFAWIFFYVITVAVVVGLYHIYKHSGKRFAIMILFFLGISFYFVESYNPLKLTATNISTHPNTFKSKHLSNTTVEVVEHLEAEKYDAFLLLPFTHMSSENMMLLGEEQASFDAFMLSYHTGLPMLNSVSSRMSQTEAIKFNNLFSPEFIEKELLSDIPENQKVALIINDDYLSPEELRMVYVHHGASSLENERFTVFEFDRKKWNNPFYYEEVLAKSRSANYQLSERWRSSKPETWFVYKSWDDQKGDALKGPGSYGAIKMDYDLLVELDADTLEKTEYTVSFWYNHYIDRADISSIVEMSYNNDEKSGWVDRFDIKQSTHIVGHWMLVEMKFAVTDSTDKIKLFITGNRSKQPYRVDELLIRKADGAALFSKGKIGGQEYLIYNNYWIKNGSFSE